MGESRIRRSDWLAMGALFFVGAILYAPSLLGYVSDIRDFSKLSFPSCVLWREAILNATFPQWNPGIFLGQPTVFEPVGYYYPGNVLFLFGPAKYSIPLSWFLHCTWGGIGGYWLARKMKCETPAALIPGIIWLIGGYTISMWTAGEKILSCSWIPWVCVSLTAYISENKIISSRAFPAICSAAMLVLAGDPTSLLFALFLACPLAVSIALTSKQISFYRVLKQDIPRMFAIVMFALLLAAPMLIPMVYLVGESSRANILPLDVAQQWSMHPKRALEFVVPGVFGNPIFSSGYQGAFLAGDPNLPPIPWAHTLFSSIALLVLFPFARLKRPAVTLLIVATIAFFLALGRYTFFDELARTIFPPFGYIRYPEKYIVVFVGAMSLLAAMGAQNQFDSPRPFALIVWTTLICTAGLLFAPFTLNNLLHPLLFGGVLCAAILVSKKTRAIKMLVPITIALDLLIAGMPMMKWTPAEKITDENKYITKIQEDSAELHHMPRLYRATAVGNELQSIPANTGIVNGIAYIPSYGPASSKWLEKLWQIKGTDGEDAARFFNINWLMLPPPVRTNEIAFQRRTDNAQLIQLASPPRTMVVGNVWQMPTRDAFKKVASHQFDSTRSAIVNGATKKHILNKSDVSGVCRIVLYEPETVSIDCNCDHNALMVLADQYWAGWYATVNGHSTPVLRTNVVMRGVYIPSGRSRVQFEYHTPGLKLGILVLAATLLFILALVLITYRRSRA